MMATASGTARNKAANQNLTRSRTLGPKTKLEPESNADGSGRKTVERALPNYLKPTVSSRPDPVKFLRKNKAVEDKQKLLRRRSFDRPLSSSSNTSPPAGPRDRPAVPREKPVTGLRSTSLRGSSRGGLRGNTMVKSSPVASRGPPGVKKSGLRGTTSSKSKKDGSEKKSSGKEIVKVEIDVQVSDHREEPRDEEKAQPDASTEEEKRELINEEQNNQENSSEDKEEVEKKVNDEENSDKEEESESSKMKVGTRETNAHAEERTEKQVVKGKKGSPTAYNDVIASRMQESTRKNKVLALAGAFQTVIDCETAACK